MILGGACFDGQRYGSISAKINNFFAWGRPLMEQELVRLSGASRQSLEKFYGEQIYHVDESEERRAAFRDDMNKVRRWVRKANLSGSDTRDAASILYRWLFDKHPILQDLCNELGSQLTLPGASDERRKYHKQDVLKSAIFAMAWTQGKRSLMGYQWVTRKEFADDMVMMIKGTGIRVESFIKFVRNKLGGGHFDSVGRTRWQKQLIAMSRYWEIDKDFLNHHMKEVLRAVSEGIMDNRIEQHVE